MAGLTWPRRRIIGNEVRGEKGEGGGKLYKNFCHYKNIGLILGDMESCYSVLRRWKMWFDLYFNRPLCWKLMKEEKWQEQEKHLGG